MRVPQLYRFLVCLFALHVVPSVGSGLIGEHHRVTRGLDVLLP